MFTAMGQCSVHGPYDNYHIDASIAHAGYTVSYFYRELDKLNPGSKFILFKESPDMVEDHIMFGLYHGIFNNIHRYDMYNYLNLRMENNQVVNLAAQLEGYYNSVKGYFYNNPNFLEVDLTSYNGNFDNFIASSSFVTMGDWMNPPIYSVPDKLATIQNELNTPRIFPFINYLAPGDTMSVPRGYPMNAFMGGGFANMVSSKLRGTSYIEKLQTELDTLLTPTTTQT
jgi:hypothetical protein